MQSMAYVFSSRFSAATAQTYFSLQLHMADEATLKK
jgi:hypothetical protein